MEFKSLKLYHFPGSRSARVRWAMHETLGSEYVLETLQLLQGDQYAPEFLAINPNHSVPVLEIEWADGSTQHMLESTAIVEWLADCYSSKGLAPAPGASPERADYLQMLYFAGSWMDSMLWTLRMHQDLLPEEQVDQRTVERTIEKFTTEVEPQLLRRFEAHDYACGNTFSAVDIVVGHNVNWARRYGMCQHDRFRAYVSGLAARPAFKAAFDDLAK
ncbi:MAG: glutathione S-transferase family protein [Pseudomonadota bacterium]